MKKLCMSVLMVILCLVSFCFVGCNADSVDIGLYTSDIESAYNETVYVPVTVSFSMLGEPKDGMLDKVSIIIKKYLKDGSVVKTVGGSMGDGLVIETSLPIISKNNWKKYGDELNKTLAGIVLTKENNGVSLEFTEESAVIASLNNELEKIYPLLFLKFPAKRTNIRIISDTADKIVTSRSVWISKTPYISASTTLPKRNEITFTFKGGSDSIYSKISPIIWVE